MADGLFLGGLKQEVHTIVQVSLSKAMEEAHRQIEQRFDELAKALRAVTGDSPKQED